LDILNATIKDISTRIETIRKLNDRILGLTDAAGFDAAFIEADDYAITMNEHLAKYQSFSSHATLTISADTSFQCFDNPAPQSKSAQTVVKVICRGYLAMAKS
jgi:hypothetical protein